MKQVSLTAWYMAMSLRAYRLRQPCAASPTRCRSTSVANGVRAGISSAPHTSETLCAVGAQ